MKQGAHILIPATRERGRAVVIAQRRRWSGRNMVSMREKAPHLEWAMSSNEHPVSSLESPHAEGQKNAKLRRHGGGGGVTGNLQASWKRRLLYRFPKSWVILGDRLKYITTLLFYRETNTTVQSPVDAASSRACALPAQSWWRWLSSAGPRAEQELARLPRPCETEPVAAWIFRR